MAALLAFSLKPVVREYEPSAIQEAAHNFLHVPAYVILTVLLIKIFMVQSRKLWERAAVLAFVLAFAYGLGIEFLQGLIPGRNPSLLDVVLNSIGAGIGILSTKRKKDLT